MIVAIASGKGGTGKTTVAAGLARIWTPPLQVVDLDVEAPNLHLFLKPDILGRETAYITVPVADESKCTACGKCAELCQFKAITVLGGYLLTFPEMCHGCGGCMAICPEGAISKGRRELGELLWGKTKDADFIMGRLRVGEAMSPPLMRQVQDRYDTKGDVIVDAPPGTSCPAMTAVEVADVIILVGESTPFGFHDLKLAREAFTAMNKPMGVVINRAGLGDDSLRTYCQTTGLPILMEIPFDRDIAYAYSNGLVISELGPKYEQLFKDLAQSIRQLSQSQPEAHHA